MAARDLSRGRSRRGATRRRVPLCPPIRRGPFAPTSRGLRCIPAGLGATVTSTTRRSPWCALGFILGLPTPRGSRPAADVRSASLGRPRRLSRGSTPAVAVGAGGALGASTLIVLRHCAEPYRPPGGHGTAVEPGVGRDRCRTTPKDPMWGPSEDVSAVTYSPTPSPGQYHRRWRA
jgi:hypothetical protein